MFKTLKAKFKDLEYGRVGSFGNDVSTPENYRKAMWHFHLFDHAFLRERWTNLAEIRPGVWRSNQPSPKRIATYAGLGIKTVISLRGDNQISYNLLEKKACADHGITLLHTKLLTARSAVSKEQLLDFLTLLETLEKPFLIHCKSGADRAGIASALYLLHIENVDLAEAQKQLSFRFMHLKSTKTGILDHVLECYAADIKNHGKMPIKTWLESYYDRDKTQASFQKFKRFP